MHLCQTGDCVDENQGPSQSHDKQLEYYIPADGPNVSTPAAAVNLWHVCIYLSFIDVLTIQINRTN